MQNTFEHPLPDDKGFFGEYGGAFIPPELQGVMDEITSEYKNIIKEIAENLDCGFNCYYNSNTSEIVTIPNFSDIADEEEFKEIIQEALEKINKQKAGFVKFEVLESFESFKIMERFVEQISDQQFKSELENILQKKKPFQNFKYLLDNSD